jgi:phosphatidate cytidylyltransferase
MRQRSITAFFFAIAMLCGVYGGKVPFFILFSIITAGCAWELSGLLLADESGKPLRRVLNTLFTLFPFVCIGGSLLDLYSLDFTLTLGLCLLFILMPSVIFLVELFHQSKRPFQNAGLSFLSLLYIGIPYTLLTYIAMGMHQDTAGYSPHRVWGLLWLVWTNDSFAYIIGSRMGKTKLFERISPNKTWEGTIGGAICAIIMAWVLSLYFSDFSGIEWVALALVAAIFGTLGDLVESMMKRSLGVKDSGDLLPGHGGMLDRFDAFMFALPFYFVVLNLLSIFM